jgi:hypothetical protein
MGRGSVNRKVIVAVETTPGTPVVGNRLLPSVSIDIGPKFTSKNYRAAGYKYNTTSRIHQSWGEGPLSGPLDYEQVIWPLASLISAPNDHDARRRNSLAPARLFSESQLCRFLQDADGRAG